MLLSVGGGYPTDYYLESTEIAEYFAEFLWGAFGPQTDAWVAGNKPRPFGDASVDGFDLDIESLITPAPFDGYQYANYGHFVSYLKNTLYPTGPSTYYISGAPQCVIPDARMYYMAPVLPIVAKIYRSCGRYQHFELRLHLHPVLQHPGMLCSRGLRRPLKPRGYCLHVRRLGVFPPD